MSIEISSKFEGQLLPEIKLCISRHRSGTPGATPRGTPIETFAESYKSSKIFKKKTNSCSMNDAKESGSEQNQRKHILSKICQHKKSTNTPKQFCLIWTMLVLI